MQVYLAGPIMNVPKEVAREWRSKLSKMLCEKYRIRWIADPTQFEPHIKDPLGVVKADLEHIRKSDLIIAHVPPGIQCAGTCMEICYAYQWEIPILTFGTWPGYRSPWVEYHSTWITDTLPDVMKIIASNKILELKTLPVSRH